MMEYPGVQAGPALNPLAIFAHATCSARSGFDNCNLAFEIAGRTAIASLVAENELKLAAGSAVPTPLFHIIKRPF